MRIILRPTTPIAACSPEPITTPSQITCKYDTPDSPNKLSGGIHVPCLVVCIGVLVPGDDQFEKEFAGRALIPYTVAAGGLSAGWRSHHGVYSDHKNLQRLTNIPTTRSGWGSSVRLYGQGNGYGVFGC